MTAEKDCMRAMIKIHSMKYTGYDAEIAAIFKGAQHPAWALLALGMPRVLAILQVLAFPTSAYLVRLFVGLVA